MLTCPGCGKEYPMLYTAVVGEDVCGECLDRLKDCRAAMLNGRTDKEIEDMLLASDGGPILSRASVWCLSVMHLP